MDAKMRKSFQLAFLLFGEGKQYIETRILNTTLGVVGGIFTADPTGAEAFCGQLSSMNLEGYTVYQVLNELDAAYTAVKQTNVLVPHARITAKDADIYTIQYVMTDFDPKRPAKTSATETEKNAAHQRLLHYLEDMKSAGMIPDVITDSGNGYNAYFRVNMSNTPENVKLVKDFNRICCLGYSDDIVEFDSTVTNPSRLAKLPGTWAVKGSNTPERPHRQSCILAHAPAPTVVDRATIAAYVEAHRSLLVQPQVSSVSCTGGGGSDWEGSKTAYLPDVEGYLFSQGWNYRTKPGNGCTFYIMPVCPFNPEHDNSASFLTRFPNGRVMFRCHHNSCRDNDIQKLLAMHPAANTKNGGNNYDL